MEAEAAEKARKAAEEEEKRKAAEAAAAAEEEKKKKEAEEEAKRKADEAAAAQQKANVQPIASDDIDITEEPKICSPSLNKSMVAFSFGQPSTPAQPPPTGNPFGSGFSGYVRDFKWYNLKSIVLDSRIKQVDSLLKLLQVLSKIVHLVKHLLLVVAILPLVKQQSLPLLQMLLHLKQLQVPSVVDFLGKLISRVLFRIYQMF